jgi:peptidoglycan/LPS O-acetylase OafA/YrhL
VGAQGNRYAHLDSLRAVAALLVVWTHTAEFFAPLHGGSPLLDVALRYDFGRIGVVAFFGVSGFLIPTSLQADRPDAGRAFLIRRFLRLFPVYWLSIPLGVFALWRLIGQPIGQGEIALNFTMVPDLFGARMVMTSYWTLEYELAFYAACLVLFKAGVLHARWTAAIATSVFLTLFMLGFALLVGLHRQEPGDLAIVALNFACLFLGALWRRHCDGQLMGSEKLVLAGALGVVWIVTPAACAYAIFGHGSNNPFYVTFPISYAAGVAVFVAMTSFAKVRWRPLAWIGLVSYSLYLLHPVVIYVMRFAYDHHAPGAEWPTGVQMLLAAALSVGVAALAFHLVERPAIDLGRRLTRPRRMNAPAAAPIY